MIIYSVVCIVHLEDLPSVLSFCVLAFNWFVLLIGNLSIRIVFEVSRRKRWLVGRLFLIRPIMTIQTLSRFTTATDRTWHLHTSHDISVGGLPHSVLDSRLLALAMYIGSCSWRVINGATRLHRTFYLCNIVHLTHDRLAVAFRLDRAL